MRLYHMAEGGRHQGRDSPCATGRGRDLREEITRAHNRGGEWRTRLHCMQSKDNRLKGFHNRLRHSNSFIRVIYRMEVKGTQFASHIKRGTHEYVREPPVPTLLVVRCDIKPQLVHEA